VAPPAVVLMPAGGRPGVPVAPLCCDLGRIQAPFEAPPDPPPAHRYTDAFGYTYALCDTHYHHLTQALLRHDGAVPTGHYISRPYRRRVRVAPTAAEREAAPTVTVAQLLEVRTSRGFSQRELALHLGVSRNQLAATETGQRPMTPVVARWVAKQLGGTG
jgi:DNA-binding XRE family transcriptional regulator